MGDICFVFEGELTKYRPLFERSCPPPLTVRKGADLCVQCQTSGWMYYQIDGITRVYMTTHDGNERVIDFMKNDTLIGMDCIPPGSRSVVSISCVTDIHVLPFTSAMLKEMLAQDPEFAYDLLVYYGKILRQVTYSSGNLGINNLTARLANFLLMFTDTPDYRKTGKISITQEDIASSINLSRAQVAKMLGQFRKEGIIQTGNRFVSVSDLERLKQHCEF